MPPLAPDDARRLVDERRASVTALLDGIERRLAGIREARGEWTDEEHDPEGFALVDEWSRLEGSRGERIAELDALDRAEARIDAGGFGVCDSCGREIPEPQLAHRPARTVCVACADRASRRR